MGLALFAPHGAAPARPLPAVPTLQLADGRRVRIRAIGPSDAEAEQSFFSALSPLSRYRRFLLGSRSLSESTLRALTQVDQYHHVALAALAVEGAPVNHRARAQRNVADARYVWLDQDDTAEIAIVVADDWQRQGLGRLLLHRLAQSARRSGLRRLVGHVLADNHPMQALICAAGGQIDAHPQDKALCLASLFLQLPGTQYEPPVSVSPFANFAQRPSASLPAQTRLGRVV